MNRSLILSFALCAAAGIALSGCASRPAPEQSPVRPAQPVGPKEPVQQTRVAPSVPGTPAALAASDTPSVPTDAKYTIVCMRFGEAGHVQQAKRAKDALTKATGRNGFFVLHEENQSTLYYGYYRQIERAVDPVEAGRAEKDMTYIRSLTDPTGNKLFPASLKQALPVADPSGPPEYDLARLDADKSPTDPTRRYWSIAIAGYGVDAEGSGADAGKSRKELALEIVLEARRRGVEAYYFHGPNVSTVCVGAWPRSAIREQEATHAETPEDNGQDIVVSTGTMPAGMKEQLQKTGRDYKVFEPKVEVLDPTLLKAWKHDYEHYSVNGGMKPFRITDPKTGKVTEAFQNSFLVEIPRMQPSLIRADAEPVSPVGPTAVNPLSPTAPGGRLRSLGQ